MASSTSILSACVSFLLVFTFLSTSIAAHRIPANQTFNPTKELKKLKNIRSYLRKINKPSIKTIQSPDGDVIDCVLSHLQPAFDHPQLKGKMPLEPPERPKGNEPMKRVMENFQLWRVSGESCPEGTIPIRRMTEKDILRARTVKRFGRKPVRSVAGNSGSVHEYAVAYVTGEQYYGVQTSLNIWAPRVADQYEFSLSQIWLAAGSSNDRNTIEAGSQVYHLLYGDDNPRFFIYWTADGYQTTGCYNLHCSGFVQTNNEVVLGGTISPTSSYNGGQYDLNLLVWKDPNTGHWWLQYGSGLLVGYWPESLFSHLRSHATFVEFGGEIVNRRSSGVHTSTQMGSGHFAGEGFGKSSYFRNLQVVNGNNYLLPATNLHLISHSDCYDITPGQHSVWGTYFYFGGPGKNDKCP